MGITKSTNNKKCPNCGASLKIVITWSGDSRANEWENGHCPSCRERVASEQCGMIQVALNDDSVGD